MENNPDSKVQAVVDVSGPTDFTGKNDPDSAAFLASFFGGRDVWRDASPVSHVSKESAPFLIVHGTKDENVPIEQSQELFERLQAAGVPAQFVKVDDGHTFQTPEARHRLAIEALAFFKRTLLDAH
jgi:dipeptidyl aminopeptidase/acylaminoacyl peptidase